jgi:hypothetical protein
MLWNGARLAAGYCHTHALPDPGLGAFGMVNEKLDGCTGYGPIHLISTKS